MSKQKTFSEQAIMGILLSRVEFWAERYQLSFQFWGAGNNNVYINKDTIELHSSGGFDTIQKMMEYVLGWCEKANPRIKYPEYLQGKNETND